jgi:hypothetical protein
MPTNLPQIGGNWIINGNQGTAILQNGGNLWFYNEKGSVSYGYFENLNRQVVATGWGNLVGTIVPTSFGERIVWGNGTEWDQIKIAGVDFINVNQRTVVGQNGYYLTFVNEHGNVSGGYIANSHQVVATGWGNLVGDLNVTPLGYAISWHNGTAWNAVSVGGTWFGNGVGEWIAQSGTGLTFYYQGGVYYGSVIDSNQIAIGNTIGTLTSNGYGDVIDWSNGQVWAQPRLAGAWSYNGLTQVYEGTQPGGAPSLTYMVFINEHGNVSFGYLINDAHVDAGPNWGYLEGSINVPLSGPRQIAWFNNSTWTQIGYW